MSTDPPDNGYSVQEDDAVCFSAGLGGASFGAGTIHAYLASDRQPPKIAAGISVGALSAAAMERCYRDLTNPRSEASRWTWYRRYLSFLLDRPFDVVWDSIPNPSDLVADLPPVKDPGLPVDQLPKPGQASLPTNGGEGDSVAAQMDVEARRKLFVLAKLGSWLAHLPVRISSVAWLTVRHVRHREGYPRHPAAQALNWICREATILSTLWRLLVHATRPFLITEYAFRLNGKQLKRRDWPLRPLLGWGLWITSFGACGLLILAAVGSLVLLARDLREHHVLHWVLYSSLFFLVLLMPTLLVGIWRVLPSRDKSRPPGWFGRTFQRIQLSVLRNLCLDRSLLSDFPLILKLYRLFEADGGEPTMGDCKFPVLLVTAPLQILPADPKHRKPVEGPNQLWAGTRCNLPIVIALQASMAESPWFPPVCAGPQSHRFPIESWYSDRGMGTEVALDLVDGAAVRHNPLPALFRYLERHPELAGVLSKDRSRVHLVYDVPILWKEESSKHAVDPEQPEPAMPNIVQTAFAGLRLANRRDSRQEVLRTNRISQVERAIQKCTGRPSDPPVHTVTVDEIAPAEELRVKNQLKPTETEMLTHIAAGCRQTLSVLYRLSTEKECGTFLRARAHQRKWSQSDPPGLAEVCRHCSRKLPAVIPPPEIIVPRSFSAGTGKLVRDFKNLSGKRPRIGFLAQGGVFRGSFHIGMAGAMLALNIKPDLIVGASVGTLIGAMLASILSTKARAKNPDSGDENARERLCELTNLFLKVDEQVALTKTFKAAVKDLGIRGRSPSLRLSPNEIRRMVQRGSRMDAGIAATGAPPALIDAISDLFLIPYRRTASIAADFVAGHFSKAINNFLRQISTETIERLGVNDAVLGGELIEDKIRNLLLCDLSPKAGPMAQLQPFLKDAGIALFATTVNLITERITILGAELDVAEQGKSYNFLEALLASSAFPAAFAPRRASALYPGTGRRDMFYGDGGMFDNLPAIPAFEILGEVQKDRMWNQTGTGSWFRELHNRYQKPDLFIVGSLDVVVSEQSTRSRNGRRNGSIASAAGVRANPDGPKPGVFGVGPPEAHEDHSGSAYEGVFNSTKRARLLANNEKIHGFQRAAEKLDQQLGQIDFEGPCPEIDEESERFMNGIVNAGFLSVYPADEEHLNGTFEFCKSLGMDRNKVRRSIADGCFQMMKSIHANQGSTNNSVLTRALAGAGIPRLERPCGPADRGICPHFRTPAGRIKCPFLGSEGIYEICRTDSAHKEST